MATALDNTPECVICCEHFKTPKVLTCGHTFCLKCIQQHIGDRKKSFLCPMCGQNVGIPQGGVKMFATNYILQTLTSPQDSGQTSPATGTTSQTSPGTGKTSPATGTTSQTSPGTCATSPRVTGQSKVKYPCPNHSTKEIDYYCLRCQLVLCHKCFVKEHHGHEYLGVEGRTAKEKAIELVLPSKKCIQDKIKELEETHAALLETSQNLLSFKEDACSRITKQTDKIIADIKASSEKAKTDIRNQLEESEKELTDTREKVMKKIKTFKLDLETYLPSFPKDSCTQILVSLSKIKHLEQLCEEMKVTIPAVYQYKDWIEKDFSVDMLGSVVTKSHCIPNLPNYVSKQNHFVFDISEIKVNRTYYYSNDKFNNENIIWSCYVVRYRNGYLYIYLSLLPADNPKLKYCTIDYKLSLLNLDDDNKTITTQTKENIRIKNGSWGHGGSLPWSTLTDTKNGYVSSSYGHFVVRLDITQRNSQ